MARSLITALLLSASAFGQVSESSLSGRIASADGTACPESPPAGPGASPRILLREVSTAQVVMETHADASGRFRFRNVPYASYTLEARNGDKTWASRTVKVANPSTAGADFPCPAAVEEVSGLQLPDRVVKARAEASPLETSGHLFYAAEDIRGLLAPSRENAVEALLLQSADVVPDEDGRLHARGEDAQIQYVVDGIPWSGNPTRVYSSLFHADMAKSIDVLSGGLPARYGAGSAVVNVVTRDGLDIPFSVRASAGAASHGTREADVAAGGRLGERVGLSLSASRSTSERYLDPISGFDAIHDEGEGNHAFAKLTAVPVESAELRIMGGYDATKYDIPNLFSRNPAQDQAQDLLSYLVGARLDVDPGTNVHMAAALYSRGTQADLRSGGLSTISGPADSAKALSQNERFFLGAGREENYNGGALELFLKPTLGGKTHRFRAGVSGEFNPLSESFAFAITDSGMSGPDGDARLRPYDISRGGSPLTAEQSGSAWAAAAYVEDGFEVGRWSFLSGLRYDVFSLFETEQAVSPRLAASFSSTSNLDLRLSLDWLAARAPLENILLSSSPALLPLSGSEQGSTPTTVGAERSVVLDLGANYRWGSYIILDGGMYGKYIRNFLVKSELGNSGLIFPINLKQGMVAGGKLQARLREWRRVSGSLSLGSCVSLGLKPEDGSNPIAAGLLVGEEGHNYGHPFAREDAFPTEHNQLFTGVLNLRYRIVRGLAGSFGARFDSGLPFDLVAADGSTLDEAQSRAELKRRGYGDDVIDLLALEPEEPGSPDKSVAPHAVFDLGLEYRLPLGPGPALELRAVVLNVLDTPYLYKFESSFGSTHFGRPRTLGFWASLDY
ncbi:MAG: TonB-dependent receptor [Fibrobacteres bacterium]|nr:TonB-dependent receptor [Fibrobacterota bacterium]